MPDYYAHKFDSSKSGNYNIVYTASRLSDTSNDMRLIAVNAIKGLAEKNLREIVFININAATKCSNNNS